MGVDDVHCNLDIWNLQDLVFDNIEKESSSWLTGELCVPTDPIEDLDWFPSFKDDFISLNDVGFMQSQPDHDEKQQTFVDFPVTPELQEEIKAKQSRESTREDEIEPLPHGVTTKKARTKNYHKPKHEVTWVKKRCSHCETDETPQWRNGPLGPKTLCNACGVRFKSGRLLPEYRPATSPTFDSTKHSNYHRKILKRRCLD